MTIDEARKIVTQEPWRWREVWDEAQLLYWEHSHVVRHQAAAKAANLARLLVPLTLSAWSDEADRPHGRDVLALYVRAVRLAMGHGWLLWLHGAVNGMMVEFLGDRVHIGGPVGGTWVHADGTVECGPVCQPLPEVRA